MEEGRGHELGDTSWGRGADRRIDRQTDTRTSAYKSVEVAFDQRLNGRELRQSRRARSILTG